MLMTAPTPAPAGRLGPGPDPLIDRFVAGLRAGVPARSVTVKTDYPTLTHTSEGADRPRFLRHVYALAAACATAIGGGAATKDAAPSVRLDFTGDNASGSVHVEVVAPGARIDRASVEAAAAEHGAGTVRHTNDGFGFTFFPSAEI